MNKNTIKHPILKTIVYGLACGLLFVPLSLAFNSFMMWPEAVCLTLWLFLGGYTMLLSRWGNKAFKSTLFPLLILVPAFFLSDSIVLFFILALLVVSWIRSGVCYQQTGLRGLAVELLLCFLGAGLVQLFTPGSALDWALGVWMFFLVQALYFVFFGHTEKDREELSRMDDFEHASRQADRILTEMKAR